MRCIISRPGVPHYSTARDFTGRQWQVVQSAVAQELFVRALVTAKNDPETEVSGSNSPQVESLVQCEQDGIIDLQSRLFGFRLGPLLCFGRGEVDVH